MYKSLFCTFTTYFMGRVLKVEILDQSYAKFLAIRLVLFHILTKYVTLSPPPYQQSMLSFF